MRKTICLFVLLAGLLVLTSCNVNVTVNGLPPEEYYISTEYPDYEIVKTAAVADIKAYLLKGAEDYQMVYFKDGKYNGGTSKITSQNPGIHNFADSYGCLVIVAGENPDRIHTSYTLPFRDKPEIGDNLVESLTPNKDDWNQTLITRDVSQQEYILDIYLLPVYYNLDLQNTRWDDGSLL